MATETETEWTTWRFHAWHRISVGPLLLRACVSVALFWALCHFVDAGPTGRRLALLYSAALTVSEAVDLGRRRPCAASVRCALWALEGSYLAAHAALFLAPVGPMADAWVAAFVLVAVSDAAQYAFGRALGRHRTNRWSPNKTLEGYAGGFVAAWAFAWLTSAPDGGVSQLTAVVVVVVSLGFLGDAAASALKRRLGVKDFGSALGQQGGWMDRLDSSLFLGLVPAYVAAGYLPAFRCAFA